MNRTNNIPSQEIAAIHAAAEWYALLCSEEATERDKQRWQDWHSADPLHQRAWQRIENMRDQLGSVPGKLSGSVLSTSLSRRSALRKITAISAIGLTSWSAYRAMPWQAWSADYRTATGEQLRYTLTDHSLMMLNTSSAADVAFSSTERLIRLHQGEIAITTFPDPHARPFIVETVHGRIQALGTRFLVRKHGDDTQVTVLEKAVKVSVAGATRIIHAGEQLRFDGLTIHAVRQANPFADSWQDGSLITVDMPLGELLAELNRYRSGFIICDPAIADLRISGAFPLHDTEQALTALRNGFPLTMSYRSRYWVKVSPA